MEEEKGVSFGKLCKVAVHRWKLLIVVTGVITIAGALLVTLGINKSNEKYSTTFNYVTKSLGKEKYCDGNEFSYKSIISKESLEVVKAAKEEYANIDIDSLLKNNDISISRSVESGVSASMSAYSYTVVVRGKYFSSSLVAKDFIRDLSEKPLLDDKQRLADSVLNLSLLNFDTTDTYEKQIKFLGSQADSLNDLYEYVEKDIESAELRDEIVSNVTAIDTIMNEDIMNQLKNRYLSEGFVKDYNALEIRTYESTITALEFEMQRNLEIIAAVEEEVNELGQSVSLSTLQEVVDLTIRNSEIEHQLEDMRLQIANKNNTSPEFIAKHEQYDIDLKAYRDALDALSEQTRNFLHKVYIKDAYVAFKDPNVVVSTGTISLAVAILLPLLVGFVAGCVVNLVVDRKLLHE